MAPLLVLDTVMVSIIAASIRFLYAVHQASQDRMSFLSAINHRPVTGPALVKMFDAVPFRRHVRAVFFFRDPWQLYDQQIRDARNNPISELPVVQMAEMGPDMQMTFMPFDPAATKH